MASKKVEKEVAKKRNKRAKKEESISKRQLKEQAGQLEIFFTVAKQYANKDCPFCKGKGFETGVIYGQLGYNFCQECAALKIRREYLCD